MEMTNEIDLVAFTQDFFGNIAKINQQAIQREEEFKRQYEHEDDIEDVDDEED